jgi:hypothetical protein
MDPIEIIDEAVEAPKYDLSFAADEVGSAFPVPSTIIS